MTSWAARLAALATGGAAFFVLLLYAPALDAPFLEPKFAALELGAAMGLLAFCLARVAGGRPRWARPVAIGALLVVGTSAVAWAWAAARASGTGGAAAPYAVSAMARWGALFGLACGASVLDDAPALRQRVLEAVTIAAAAVASIGLLQHLELLPLSIPVISTPGSTFGNRNLAAEVMAMALPLGVGAAVGTRAETRAETRSAAAAVTGRPAGRRDARAAMLVSLALELVYLAVTRARGAWVGAGCGLGATAWLMRALAKAAHPSHTPGTPGTPRTARTVVAGAIVAASVVAAFVPGRFNPRDAGDAKRYSGLVEVLEDGFDARSTALKTRLGLWRRTVTMVRDHPLFGVGPGNWPVVFPLYAEPGATHDGVLSAALAPRQAHDDWLERAAETGIPGLLALGALGVGAAMAVRRRLVGGDDASRVTTAAAAGSGVALGALCIASFPLEMPGTLALAGLALGLVAGDARRPTAPAVFRATPRAIACASLAAALIVVPCVALRAVRRVRASLWLGVAARAMHRELGGQGDRGHPADSAPPMADQAAGALERARALAPGDFRIELRAAQLLLRQGRAAESTRAADRALSVEPYSPNAWASRADADLFAGDTAAARRNATRALGLLHDYPVALDLRARAAKQDGDEAASEVDREHLRRLAADATNPEAARKARTLLDKTP